jgi:prepilin-type N-terminal cleavage/methylation domain-containing protein/prepilin-type processing-associated H-X9-DG protein
MKRRRRGFTMIELLMVMAIIGVLFSLLLPAVLGARASGRRVQCLNNLRQVGLAMIQVGDRQGRYPASGYFSAIGPEQYFSWVVPVLNDLDQSDIASAWDISRPWDDTSGSNNAMLAQTSLAVLACPSDISVAPGQGNLSYVVNGGFGWTEPVDCPVAGHWGGIPTPVIVPFDFTGDGMTCATTNDTPVLALDKALYLKTGLFFLNNWPAGTGTTRHHSPASVTDGSATTLMLSENIRAGYDPVWGTSWASPWPTRNSFLLSSYACQNARCAPGAVNYQMVNTRSAAPQSFEAINSSISQAEGEAPWPSSLHGAGVNVIMCDGHGTFLSETVDGAVYAALVSPQGMRILGPLQQQLIGDIGE